MFCVVFSYLKVNDKRRDIPLAHSFVAYIDEAGDDGIGRFRELGKSGQTHWLVLSACIVSAENDRFMPSYRNEILNAFPKKKAKDLHFVDLNHEQRVYACTFIASKPLGAVSIISDKRSLIGIPNEFAFRQKNYLYKYMLRYLMERISVSCMRRAKLGIPGDGRAQIIFSRRGGMDYEDFIEYMKHLRQLQRIKGTEHRMEWDHIDIEGSRPMDHPHRAGLQIADIIASSFHRAVEPNPYGGYEPRYAEELKPIVLRGKDKIYWNFGIKVMSRFDAMSLDQAQISFFKMWK